MTETTDWATLVVREKVALAIYRADHPDYTDPDMGNVPLLDTVQRYRRYADAAMPYIAVTPRTAPATK